MFIGILMDMFSAFNLFAGQIIPSRGWFSSFYFPNERLLGSIYFVFSYGGRCVQGGTACILSFCRVSAVCFPILYRKLGHPEYAYTMHFFQMIGVVLMATLLLPRDYKYMLVNGRYYSELTDDTFQYVFHTVVATLNILCVVCVVVNNLITYVQFHLKFNKKGAVRGNVIPSTQYQMSRGKQKREASLERMTFIVSCMEILYFAFTFYAFLIQQSLNKRIFYFLYNILCAVYSSYSAWMLLIVSKPITTEFRQKFSKMSTTRSVRSVSSVIHS
uniref:Uncharacterized protein n=1 Tax=Caenorhabditis japonica TaxID=281687 RepID=A0A8R1HSJ3_CAEJA